MNEFELIERYFRRDGGDGVLLGIGDDGAVLEAPPGRDLVVVADTQVADVHFPGDMAAADIGWRSVAVNLSDIAAMGATPAWMTLALTLPSVDEGWLDGFAGGLHEIAAAFGVALVGGDTTRGPTPVITVQIIGHAPRDSILTRSGGCPGDRVYVSGTVGDAAAGLAAWRAGERDGALVDRLRRPAPRVVLGQRVAGLASAAIDVSDGLAADLSHILEASGCGACLEVAALPLSAALRAGTTPDAARRHALGGGDDYELCVTVPPHNDTEFRAAADAAEVAVTAIGVLEAEPGLRLEEAGSVTPLADSGYRHF